MLSYTHRSLFAVSLLLSSALCCLANAPAPKPTPKQIAQWIEQLGDKSYTVRENASEKLWQAGAAAESALEKALKSGDAEVVRRARELLDKFRWGIYANTPDDVVALIRAYQSSQGKARMEVLQKLLEGGDAALRAVLKIVRAETNENQRKALGAFVAKRLPAAFLRAVTEEQYEYFEHLLELGHEGKFVGQTKYAAYWLLRGKLAERITDFRMRLREHAGDKWSAQTLAYLHRANGDLIQARRAAQKADRADLLEGILYEMGDWKALAARAEGAAKEKSSDKGVYHIAGTIPAEEWAYRAAFARLAGKPKEFDNAVRRLPKFAADKENRESKAFVAVKGLLLNDRPAEALDILRTWPERRVLLFDLLCARLDFGAAIDLAEKEVPTDKEIPNLGLARARLLCMLGDKEGEKLFDRYGERIKDKIDPQWIQALLTEEMRAGLKGRAFAHAAKALEVAPKKWTEDENGTLKVRYFAQLFPQQPMTADVWWPRLRTKFKDESTAAVMKRLRKLMEGKIAAEEVKKWIEEWIEENEHREKGLGMHSWVWRQTLAEAALKAGLDKLAILLLEKAESREALLLRGDLLAAKKQWLKAAECYKQAQKKRTWVEWYRDLRSGIVNVPTVQESPDPLSLYLAGDALVHAGQEKAGKKLIEQSHWFPWTDGEARFNFLRALIQRGHREAAQREADLLLRVSEPNSFYSGEGLRRRASAALKRKDYLQAAEGVEQSMLRCLHPYTNFVSNASYANMPAQIHQLRAQGLLAAGKLDEALKQADLALVDSPGYVDLPITLVPELERRGHKKEAMNLFNRCYGAYEKVCRVYPRCAWAHNSAAWLSVCCRRNLDKAMQHADKAVELAPTNAGYLDTLAEVHFQRGDKDEAIALQKRAIELDPKKTYFRKQLKRLEAGDPSAERPPENDE